MADSVSPQPVNSVVVLVLEKKLVKSRTKENPDLFVLYLSAKDLIFGTNGGGPLAGFSVLESNPDFLRPPGRVGNLSTIFSVV